MIDLVVPPGQHAPLAVVTDTDHTAWIIIATTLGLAISILFGAIRILVRCTANQSWGHDDTSLAAATLLTVIQSAILLSACSHGLGKSIELVSPDMIAKIQELYYTVMLLFIVCLGMSKVSVTFFLLRLTPIHGQKRVFRVASALVVLWTVVFLFALALQCNMTHPWISIGEVCPGSSIRWQAFCAFDIVFELGLVGMSAYLVWDIQTSNSLKGLVVFAFCFRLPMIVAIAFRLKTFSSSGFTINPTLLQGEFIIWTQTELNYSLISATIPCLRPFVTNLATHYGGFGRSHNADGSYGTNHGSRNANRNQSFQMNTLKSANSNSNPQGHTIANAKHSASAHLDHGNRVDVSHVGKKKTTVKPLGYPSDKEDSRRTSLGSNDSQRMIIRKDITWTVE